MANGIQHVFVLMLENRSFDHMLGFSGITGIDASSGGATQVTGLSPLALRPVLEAFQVNSIGGIVQKEGQNWPPLTTISARQLLASNSTLPATEGADFVMPLDPGHAFLDVLMQLCGQGIVYLGGQYPPVVNTGFAANYAAQPGFVVGQGPPGPGEIMKCYSPSRQLPVLNQLATEFVVCDNWHASMPGPTWPNRFFAHAASSGGLDHSPSTGDLPGGTVPFGGFGFPNGTIFDRMNDNNLNWRIYAGDDFPIVLALNGINFNDINDYGDFAADVSQPDYPASYTFIEPSYGDWTSGTFKCGTSQHPLDDVTRGESLIKATYESLRASPLWGQSLLIITWDEHGGFYDHLPPPPAVAPGDTPPGSPEWNEWNQYGFTFQQYGPRVPAVVISPLISRNLIDHRLYDHASIPATIEACFGLSPMTQRDARAANLMTLITQSTPRSDTPATLHAPAPSGVTGCDPVSFDRRLATGPAVQSAVLPVTRPQDSIDEGNLPGFLSVVLRSDLALTPPEQQAGVLARFNTIKTRQDAASYVSEVAPKVRAARNALSGKKT